MRIVLQRVAHASVTVEGQLISKIGRGLLILVGVEDADTFSDAEWLAKKVVHLRIFDDENGVMNRSVEEVGGEVLIISQFTLFASTKKGNRPSYIRASKHEHAIPLYERFCLYVEEEMGVKPKTGKFGADMKVELLNDGPVTICIDSRQKE
ncbi:MAG: D-tyrosyl-tRNA(Tyr) deacylase [Porphyromonadaceae bacterium]|nr:D-tyrosyl-tRNA(Tyr) deacylase [Porphyromonadaceae bacterium]